MAIKILVPYNFTENDEKALQFLGEKYGKEKEIEITLFHAYTPVAEIDVVHNPIMEKMKSNLSYLRMQQEEKKQAMENGKQILIDHGMAEHSVECLFTPVKTDIASDIINLWKREAYDVVVLNRNPGNIVNYFTRSTSKRVSQYRGGVIGVHVVN